eukprot:6460513-Amphidinium_carterae.2
MILLETKTNGLVIHSETVAVLMFCDPYSSKELEWFATRSWKFGMELRFHKIVRLPFPLCCGHREIAQSNSPCTRHSGPLVHRVLTLSKDIDRLSIVSTCVSISKRLMAEFLQELTEAEQRSRTQDRTFRATSLCGEIK